MGFGVEVGVGVGLTTIPEGGSMVQIVALFPLEQFEIVARSIPVVAHCKGAPWTLSIPAGAVPGPIVATVPIKTPLELKTNPPEVGVGETLSIANTYVDSFISCTFELLKIIPKPSTKYATCTHPPIFGQ